MPMKKSVFKLLHKFNKAVLPRYGGKDPLQLTSFERAIVAYQYYGLINSLD